MGEHFLVRERHPAAVVAEAERGCFVQIEPPAHAHLPCMEEEQIEQTCRYLHTNHLQVPLLKSRQAGVFWVTVV